MHLGGNDLVSLACHNPVQHLPLPGGQPVVTGAQIGEDDGLAALLTVLFQRAMDAVEQCLIVERFFDEIEHPFLHRSDSHRYVSMAGNDDHRRVHVLLRQPRVEIETTHTGHSDVQHQATR